MERSLVLLVMVLAHSAAAPHPGRAATPLACTIHASKSMAQNELKAMAKVTQDTAQKAALASFDAGARPKIVESELEVERGCLVYSFDVDVPGDKGVTEVLVDAGSGDVLSRTHETKADEAAEKAAERKARPHK